MTFFRCKKLHIFFPPGQTENIWKNLFKRQKQERLFVLNPEEMLVDFTKSANEDYKWWEENDPKKTERIKSLLEDIKHRPFKGIGKPEPLKFDLQGYWSRRIDKTNRLVYSIKRGKITVISCRFHY